MFGTGGFRARAAALVATLALGGTTVVAVNVIAAAPAGAQMTDQATALPGLMDTMVVDPATSHVFVSLYDTGKVAVLDLSGNLVTTIDGEGGARGVAIVGSHLYVAASTLGEIDEIDTTTLTKTRTLVTGLPGIGDLANVAGALWVTDPSDGAITRVSVADGSTRTSPNPLNMYGTGLVADPGRASTLVVFTPGQHPLSVAVLDVASTPPVVVAHDSLTPTLNGDAKQIAFSPDGSTMIPAAGSPYSFNEFAVDDLRPTGLVYPGNPYPEAIAETSAAGGLVAGGLAGYYAPDLDIEVWRLGDPSAPIATHDFGSVAALVERGGIAFSPDGTHVFAVTGGIGLQATVDTFHVLTIDGATASSPLTTSAPSESFGNQRVGTYGRSQTVTVTNPGAGPVFVTAVGVSGADAKDFFGTTTCHAGASLAGGASCTATISFGALGVGARHANLVIRSGSGDTSIPLSGTGTEGYYLADSRGGAEGFGDASGVGVAEHALTAPVVAITPTSNGAGFWLLARDGGIFSYGNAAFHGSTGGIHLNKPIVGMAATPAGKGYWLVASDGGIFAFGDAAFHGSTGGIHLNKPIVGMAATPSGKGYWLVASDGGIFSFGDAKFYGSTGAIHLARPIIGMATTATGHGYEFVANDGGVFSFGDAHFYGSAASSGARIVGLAGTPTGRGYWMVSNTGRVFRYGDAPGYGDASSRGVTDVIGIAGTAPMIPPALLGATRAAAASTLVPMTARFSTRLTPRRP